MHTFEKYCKNEFNLLKTHTMSDTHGVRFRNLKVFRVLPSISF